MSTFINRPNIKTVEDIKAARDELTKILAEIKKGGDAVKVVEPVANAGAGKAEEPVTPAKAKRGAAKKTDAPSAPVKGKKPVAKVVAVEEEKPVAVKAAAAKNTDGKREFAFAAGASHTKLLKEAIGEDKKAFENAKKMLKKHVEGLSDEEFDAKTKDEHVQTWLAAKNAAKVVEPVVPEVLSYEDLKALTGLTETDTAGVYWHPETGRHVTGPIETSEEEDEIKTMDKTDYQVGESTRRVYDVETEAFLGFAGVGKFADM
jgi:hypothetical protein